VRTQPCSRIFCPTLSGRLAWATLIVSMTVSGFYCACASREQLNHGGTEDTEREETRFNVILSAAKNLRAT
jgi:hypothetical protein